MKIRKEDDFLIKKFYMKLGNIAEIARYFSVSSDTIRRSLLRSNTPLLNNLGGAKKFNKYYFDIIDSEYKSYFLGLLFSDGSIRRTTDADSWRIYFGLSEEDVYLVEAYKTALDSGHDIWSYKCDSGKYMYKHAVRNKYFGENLINKGLVPEKSKCSNFPTYLNDDLCFHFIRGVLDGDGTVCIDKNNKFRITIYGNEKFLSGMKDFLYNVGIISYLNPYPTTYGLTISKKCLSYFIDRLYNDSTIKMIRKHKKAYIICSMLED